MVTILLVRQTLWLEMWMFVLRKICLERHSGLNAWCFEGRVHCICGEMLKYHLSGNWCSAQFFPVEMSGYVNVQNFIYWCLQGSTFFCFIENFTHAYKVFPPKPPSHSYSQGSVLSSLTNTNAFWITILIITIMPYSILPKCASLKYYIQ